MCAEEHEPLPDGSLLPQNGPPPTIYASLGEAILAGARKGAKYGFGILALLALVAFCVAIAVIYSFFEPKGNPLFLLLAPLGIATYGICGAVIGAVIMGVISGSRFKRRSRSLVALNVALAITAMAATATAIALIVYWCSLPGMTTENHVFFLINLCKEDRFADAAHYIDRHPEIVTDDRAIHDGPALLAAAIFDDDPRTTQLMLDHGADVNATNVLGETALDVAIEHGRLKVAKLLLERDARPGTRFGTADAGKLKSMIEAELAKRAK